ncbi:hypothetical protein [Halanaerobacter jeridensis]|uniref:Uncharacterized protein n=1 Tax=Halanaerobacter jeridensis TaxID=706427 RepID=A0A939BRK3_9FIRM|nr:hypothetical protein [Halanaerobacter jeridensis]MBM7556101.1 hypothetical protein [Halanaerobacter jeridensis]
MILVIDSNNKIKLILILIILLLLISVQINAAEEKKSNDVLVSYNVERSLENNWLEIDKLKKLDLIDASVIPVPDLDQIPLLDEDLMYKQYNKYYTK